jgi:hypothetical protein
VTKEEIESALDTGQTITVKRSGKDADATILGIQGERVIVRVNGKRVGYDLAECRATRAAVSVRRALPPPSSDVAEAEAMEVLPPIAARQVRKVVELRKARPVRSDSFLAFVRQHPCCCCGEPRDIEAHHIVNGGIGKKASDRLTAPLTAEHHAFWHQHGHLPGRDRIGSLACMWEASARVQDAWEELA